MTIPAETSETSERLHDWVVHVLNNFFPFDKNLSSLNLRLVPLTSVSEITFDI